jgi:hypothetical protein
VSRRSKRRRDPRAAQVQVADDTGPVRGGPAGGPREAREPRTGRSPGAPGEAREEGRWNLRVQLAFLVAVFAVAVVVAELAGAANLGVALGVGQVAFAIAVVYLLVRR